MADKKRELSSAAAGSRVPSRDRSVESGGSRDRSRAPGGPSGTSREQAPGAKKQSRGHALLVTAPSDQGPGVGEGAEVSGMEEDEEGYQGADYASEEVGEGEDEEDDEEEEEEEEVGEDEDEEGDDDEVEVVEEPRVEYDRGKTMSLKAFRSATVTDWDDVPRTKSYRRTARAESSARDIAGAGMFDLLGTEATDSRPLGLIVPEGWSDPTAGSSSRVIGGALDRPTGSRPSKKREGDAGKAPVVKKKTKETVSFVPTPEKTLDLRTAISKDPRFNAPVRLQELSEPITRWTRSATPSLPFRTKTTRSCGQPQVPVIRVWSVLPKPGIGVCIWGRRWQWSRQRRALSLTRLS